MPYFKNIRFYESKTLIQFIKDNRSILKNEHINGIYHTDNLSWYEHIPNKKTWTTDRPIIVELENYVIQIDYYFASDISVRIIDRESFYKGDLTRHILDWATANKTPQPFNKVEDLNALQGTPTKIIIEKFSHEFEIEPSSGMVRLDGGDYFESIIVMFGNTGLAICPEDATYDGYMDYYIITEEELKTLKLQPNHTYEVITI